ncbi:MAG: hypothetical protein HY665_09500 [Chloroflexi bacterium]|nr:hypothetical protein [Chloroflexota bacterium]
MARLVFAIISTLLEEAAIAVIVLWGLPQAGVRLPLPVLIALMAAWLGFSAFTYHMGSRALRRKLLPGLPNMIGSEGKVACPMSPDGLVRIKGELWIAKSESGEIEPGAEVMVVGQEGLKLTVRSVNPPD